MARVLARMARFAAVSVPMTFGVIKAQDEKPRATEQGILAAVGNTPLIYIKSLSEATGCRILAKAEFMNPGGSVKDRPALQIIQAFEAEGKLVPREKRKQLTNSGTDGKDGAIEGHIIVEATGGNTGLGMAMVAAAKGYRCIFTMPASISTEKIELMKTLGAEVILCPAVPFANPAHYYQRALAIAAETPGAVLGNQFEGLNNMKAHYYTTGPEIWRQSNGKVDALVSAAGTGGTIAGLSTFLREKNPLVKVFLIDPPGSSLFNYITSNKTDTSAQPGNSIVEGIGINRITANFASASVDYAIRGKDQELLDMAFYLLRREGIFVGPSAALNVVGAVKAARQLGPGHTVVTVLCDGGDRYRSKMYNPAWLEQKGLKVSEIDFDRDHADFVA